METRQLRETRKHDFDVPTLEDSGRREGASLGVVTGSEENGTPSLDHLPRAPEPRQRATQCNVSGSLSRSTRRGDDDLGDGLSRHYDEETPRPTATVSGTSDTVIATETPSVRSSGPAPPRRGRGRPRKSCTGLKTSEKPRSSGPIHSTAVNIEQGENRKPRGRRRKDGRRTLKFSDRRVQRNTKTVLPDYEFYTTRFGRCSFRPIGSCDELVEENDVIEDQFGSGKILFTKTVDINRDSSGQDHSSRRPARVYRQKRRNEHETTQPASIIEPEPWEETIGSQSVICQDLGDSDTEYCEKEIAFSSKSILQLHGSCRGLVFGRVQVMTSIFVGVLHLEKGEKKEKRDSGESRLIFHIHTGKVEVEFGERSFRISKDSMFVVPRGNQYAITGVSNGLARLSFTQIVGDLP